MHPKVSVITALYNHEEYIMHCIDSVNAQTYKDIEHVIVDDGSSDNSAYIVENLINRQIGNIRFIRLNNNRGGFFARNEAIEASRGEYIALLDSDDMLLPDSVNMRVRFLESHPDIDFLHARSWYVYGTGGINELERFEETWTHRKVNAYNEYGASATSYWDTINQQTVMIRRDTLKRVGLFDESLRYKGDKELWFRMLHNGCKLAYIPEFVALYRHHGTNISRSREKFRTPVEEQFMQCCLERATNGITPNNTRMLTT